APKLAATRPRSAAVTEPSRLMSRSSTYVGDAYVDPKRAATKPRSAPVTAPSALTDAVSRASPQPSLSVFTDVASEPYPLNSTPSPSRSPSESPAAGSEPIVASNAEGSPSWSGSSAGNGGAGRDDACAGSLPSVHSAPSVEPSASESSLRGSVPADAAGHGSPERSMLSGRASLSSSASQASPAVSEFTSVVSSKV